MIVKRLTQLFMILVVLDGAMRKWMLPAYSEQLYLLKDAVLACAILALCVSRSARLQPEARRTLLPFALVLYGSWAVVESLNPHLPSYRIALLGLRSHVLYLFLLVLAPLVVPAEESRLQQFLSRYIRWLALPVMLLAVFQYFQPQDSIINRYAAEVASADISTAGFAARVRVTGTFSYISGMATFLLFNIALAMGLSAAALRFGGKYVGMGTLLLAAALTAAPMTGSRSTLYFPILALPLVLYHASDAAAIRRRLLPILGLCGLAFYGISQSSLGEGWTSFNERSTQAADSRQRVIEAFQGPIWRAMQGGALGFGTGSTHQAAPKLVPALRPFEWLPTADFEEENGRVGLELGIAGLVLFLTIKILMVQLSVQLLARSCTPSDIIVGAAGVVFFAAHLLQPVVFNPVAAALYWSLGGVMVARWCYQYRESVRSARTNRVRAPRNAIIA